MNKRVLSKCPVCNHQLTVKSLYCTQCNTEINGTFTLNKFNYLTKEQLSFVEVFVKNRGNIKDVEKDLKISYPTVRRLLDEVITSLGYKPSKNVSRVNKTDILDRLERGEISAEEATKLLNKED